MRDRFLSCDWGTSRLRLRLVHAPSGTVEAERCSSEGAVHLAAISTPANRAEVFRSTLASHVAALGRETSAAVVGLPVVASGMVTSSLGWRQLPYAQVPFSLDGRDLMWETVAAQAGQGETGEGEPSKSASGNVCLLSGVRSDRDVMRGEETEAMGLCRLPLCRDAVNDALVIFPGTHSKHLRTLHGRITDFQTFLTGELFGLLSTHGSLKHPAAAAGDGPAGDESLPGELLDVFRQGVDESARGTLSSALFQVRVRQLLADYGAASTEALLSGILIGAEIASLGRCPHGEVCVILAAGPTLSERYQIAIQMHGLDDRLIVVPPHDVDRLSALGQAVALEHILPDITGKAGNTDATY